MTMTPTQQEAALRLADNMDLSLEAWMDQAATMLRELAAEPQGEPVAWRDVVGFEGFYEVSSDGQIRNFKTGLILASNKMGAGYIKADLWRGSHRKQTSVHRVVAEAFIGSLHGREVNHINGDKTDNRLVNLEVVTRSQNERHSRSVLGNLVKPVIARCVADGAEIEYESIEATARGGFIPSNVYRCAYGVCQTHKGYEFRFKHAEHANGEKLSRDPAHPPQQRKPLTDDQIEDIAGNTRPCANRDILFARAIERHYGIGEAP